MEYDRVALANAREENYAVVCAMLAQATALDRIATALDGLMKMARDSACGHGTPTLFSPCIDCQRRASEYPTT